MLPTIDDYQKYIGSEKVGEIKDLAIKLEDKHIAHFNSTYSGGGVAEILNSMVVLMNSCGIKTDWRLLKGSHSFFDVTKKFHNALQGQKVSFNERDRQVYLDELERNSVMNHFRDHDLVFIHDPQPLGLVDYIKKKKQPWIWRCHIEIKNPDMNVWSFLRNFAQKYDGAIFSQSSYNRKDVYVPQFFIAPSIDPLSMKNKELSFSQARKILLKEGIDTTKPIITQVSRFDKWKNPIGVLEIFRKVRERKNVSLVLIGDMAADDPEGPKIYNSVIERAKKIKDVHVLTKKDDLLVNALQKYSHIVLQNSRREGFGLTVSEALWKGTPVIGTWTGGIPQQIIHGKTGALVGNQNEAVSWCIKLLNDEKLRKEMGENAREHVRKNFLITRQLYDYMKVVEHYTATLADNFMGAARYLRRYLR